MQSNPVPPPPPIYVDLDGTLIHTDLLWESLLSAMSLRPRAAVAGLWRLRDGRAAMKRALAEAAEIDVGALPYDARLLQWLRDEAARGRRIVLATAADATLAHRVAAHLGVFTDVLASDGALNLKGAAKLAAVRDHAGSGGFVYCGNGPEDLVLFAAAAESVLVNAPADVEARARDRGSVTRVFAPRPAGPSVWLRALRAHQWLKNLLVFLPLIAAFRLSDPHALSAAFAGFLAFCLVASGGYLINDLLDLGADRAHPGKRQRPLATGLVSVPSGLLVAGALLAGGLALGKCLSGAFAGWLLIYAALTLAYSLAIKRLAVFDLIALAALYTVRILAGGAAIQVEVSFWLLAFSVFLFFSLATIKRCGELWALRARAGDAAVGRAYRAVDLEVLKSIGTATSVAAVLVLALYVQTADVALRYATPRLLWLVLAGLLTWLSHLWLVTWRGGMHDDPLVFTLRDPTSRWLIGVMGLAFGAAALLRTG